MKCGSDKVGLIFKDKEYGECAEHTCMWTENSGLVVKCWNCGSAMIIGGAHEPAEFVLGVDPKKREGECPKSRQHEFRELCQHCGHPIELRNPSGYCETAHSKQKCRMQWKQQ